MNSELPWSAACERNKDPILECLLNILPASGDVLEVGSCTGQHVCWFAPRTPGLTWWPSDRVEYLDGLRARISLEGVKNCREPFELDVLEVWPGRSFDAVYSANTAHIMSWKAVCALFGGVGSHLVGGGVFCLYGPFNLEGQFTSQSNREFDASLRSRDPEMGIRDIRELESLADRHQMKLQASYPMPANNQLLEFTKIGK